MNIGPCPYCGNNRIETISLSLKAGKQSAHWKNGCGREVKAEGEVEVILNECPTKAATKAD